VSSGTTEEVFKFVVRHSYILIEGLCVVLSASRMCTVQVPLHYYTVVLLLGYPVFRRIPHFSLPRRVGVSELVDVHDLEGGPFWCPSLSDRETTIYFLKNLWFH